MIKRILLFIVGFFILAFILLWMLGGGFQSISSGMSHYRNPFHYTSIFDYFFQIGSTTGESFKLPGTPSTYPTVSISNSATGTTERGPTTVYEPGSNGGDGGQQ
jgi:hypothetical protein